MLTKAGSWFAGTGWVLVLFIVPLAFVSADAAAFAACVGVALCELSRGMVKR